MTATKAARSRGGRRPGGHGSGSYVPSTAKETPGIDRPPLSRWYFEVVCPGQTWVWRPSELAHTEAEAVAELRQHYLYVGGVKWVSYRLVSQEAHEGGDFKRRRLTRPVVLHGGDDAD